MLIILLPYRSYVKRQNSAPKLGILIPEVTSEYECLYFNQLPFAEDVR